MISTAAKKENVKYPKFPEIYPRLDINLKFKRKHTLEKGALKCDTDPDYTSLKYCDSGKECPCGLEHCHILAVPSLTSGSMIGEEIWKKGVCTPPNRTCNGPEDCPDMGAVHSGKVGASCVPQEGTGRAECKYGMGVIIA